MNFDDLDGRTIDRIIEMAWEDRTPFEAIEEQFGLKEKEVIKLMRNSMKGSSFKMWRKRVSGRGTKHLKKRGLLIFHWYLDLLIDSRSVVKLFAMVIIFNLLWEEHSTLTILKAL